MPRFPYRILSAFFNRNFRNDLNQNFADIESDIKELGAGQLQALEAASEAETQAIYAQEQGDYANEKGTFASDQGTFAQTQADRASSEADRAAAEADRVSLVADENKTRFLPAVAAVADRDTAYPAPAHGDTVRVTGESKTYRYDRVSGWVVTDQYNPTAIDEVNTKLAEKATATSLGHVQIGTGISVDENGVISVAEMTASNVSTTNGSDVQTEIDSLKSSVSSGKQGVRDAITGKGGIVTDSDGDGIPSFVELSTGINKIPFLPNEYKGQRWQLQKSLGSDYSNYSAAACYLIDGDTLLFVGDASKTVKKYVHSKSTVTDLGFATTNKPMSLWSSDDGSIIYAEDSVTGIIYYLENNVWTSTGQTASLGDDRYAANLTCKPDGSELYYVNGMELRKWTKATNTMTVLYTHTYGLGASRPRLWWVNDNSVWVYASNPSQVMLKISLSTGGVVISSPDSGFIGQVAMCRSPQNTKVGAIMNNTSGSNPYIFMLYSDGTWTQGFTVSGYEGVIPTRENRYVGWCMNTTTTVLDLHAVTSTWASAGTIASSGPECFTEDLRRWKDGSAAYSSFVYE